MRGASSGWRTSAMGSHWPSPGADQLACIGATSAGFQPGGVAGTTPPSASALLGGGGAGAGAPEGTSQ